MSGRKRWDCETESSDIIFSLLHICFVLGWLVDFSIFSEKGVKEGPAYAYCYV